MNLLLVNDDGINSRLLAVLCRAVAARGHHVTVCAPSTQQSAKAHGFTVLQPIMVHPWTMEGAAAAWAVDGTPVDCVRLGLMELADTPIDLVISGINDGYNAGLATYTSGTVGAAREAAFHGKKAMALSMQKSTPDATMLFFADWSARLAEHLAAYDAPPMSVCNVNVPPVPVHALRPPRVCPISQRMWRDEYERRQSPRGDVYFWLSPHFQEFASPGSDIEWLRQGHITCTFLTPSPCDQSAYADFFDAL